MEQIPTSPIFHKPMSIIAAKNILYATLFLGVIIWAINQWGTEQHPASPIAGLILLLLTVLIVFGLIRQIGRGKRWPRTVLLVLFLAGLLAFPWTIAGFFKANLLVGVFAVLQVLLQLIALVYLFSRASTAWFNRVHTSSSNEPAPAPKH